MSISRVLIILLILNVCFLCIISAESCKKKESKTSLKPNPKVVSLLRILTIDRIKASNFFQHVVPPFEKNKACKIEILSVRNSSELLTYVDPIEKDKKIDIVFGLDNCIFADPEDFEKFIVNQAMTVHPVNQSFIIDNKHRLIPYAFGYLAILYNEKKINDPPTSFGELQDSRFYNQMIVSDPREDSISRAIYYWTIALFGDAGYQLFWKSIKKNIQFTRASWQEVLVSLIKEECGMVFGFTNTPAWYLETHTNPLPIKAATMREGSFLYTESAAISKKSKNKVLSEQFLVYLLSPEVQRFVAYDLGLFPTNESTPLPPYFSSTLLTGFTVNEKLNSEFPTENASKWLDFWDKLFSRNLITP